MRAIGYCNHFKGPWVKTYPGFPFERAQLLDAPLRTLLCFCTYGAEARNRRCLELYNLTTCSIAQQQRTPASFQAIPKTSFRYSHCCCSIELRATGRHNLYSRFTTGAATCAGTHRSRALSNRCTKCVAPLLSYCIDIISCVRVAYHSAAAVHLKIRRSVHRSRHAL